MTWNHRVIRTEFDGDFYYSIHECHYDGVSEIPTTWTEDQTDVSAETREGLVRMLDWMKEAVSKPILAIKDGKLIEVEK